MTRGQLASLGQLGLEMPLDSCEQVFRDHIFLFAYGAFDLANLVLNFRGRSAWRFNGKLERLFDDVRAPARVSSSAQANTTMTFFISKGLSMPRIGSAVSVRPERPRQRRGWTVALSLGVVPGLDTSGDSFGCEHAGIASR
jgi:hypothetical protein